MPGLAYGEAIINGLDNSEGLILLLSKHANASPFVHVEVERAFSKRKQILLIRLEDVLPCKALELFLSSVQWLDRWDSRFSSLLTNVAQQGSQLVKGGMEGQGQSSYKQTKSRLSIRQGDITKVAMDAIVTPSDHSYSGNSGLQGIVHFAAGPRLREYCRKFESARTGTAQISPGFDLPAKQIIHSVTPHWKGDVEISKGKLALCYKNIFEIAQREGIRSMAIPLLGSGNGGFPPEVAAAIAIREILFCLNEVPEIQEVWLMSKTDDTFLPLRKIADDNQIH